MNARTPTDFQFSFKGFTERGGSTDIHADGWGLSLYSGRGIQSFHDVQPSSTSPIANLLSTRLDPIKTHNVIAHIRYATVGNTTLENVHPFQRELWGRNWAFAHNGDLPHFSNVENDPQKHFHAVGTTDSEAVFVEILNRLNSNFDTSNGAPSSCELFEFLSVITNEIIEGGKEYAKGLGEKEADYQPIFNFLLCCGEGLQFAFCYPGARPNSTTWNSLHYIVRRHPFKKARLVDNPEIEIDFAAVTSKNDQCAIIATQPLTAEDEWIEMKRGELLMFEYGQPFGTSKCSDTASPSKVIADVEDLNQVTSHVEFDSLDLKESLTSNPNFGKGDDTIKEINKFKSITIDPNLATDPSFWDYALIPTDQGGLTLDVLNLNSDESFSQDLLVEAGATIEDVEYYDIFNSMCSRDPGGKEGSAIVVWSDNLKYVDLSVYDKIVVVRSDNDDSSNADIKVSSLGELRALSICSYALLNKKS